MDGARRNAVTAIHEQIGAADARARLRVGAWTITADRRLVAATATFTLHHLGARGESRAHVAFGVHPDSGTGRVEFSPTMIAGGTTRLPRSRDPFEYVALEMLVRATLAEPPTRLNVGISRCVRHRPDDRTQGFFEQRPARFSHVSWCVDYLGPRAPDSLVDVVWQRSNDRADPDSKVPRAIVFATRSGPTYT